MASKEFLELRKKIIEKDFKYMNDKQREAIFQVNGPVGYDAWDDYCLDIKDSKMYSSYGVGDTVYSSDMLPPYAYQNNESEKQFLEGLKLEHRRNYDTVKKP